MIGNKENRLKGVKICETFSGSRKYLGPRLSRDGDQWERKFPRSSSRAALSATKMNRAGRRKDNIKRNTSFSEEVF
jgi:hypothetical protein